MQDHSNAGSVSGRMIDWLDRDLAWKNHGRPLCAICDEPAEYVILDGAWYRLRHVRRDALTGSSELRCADHGLCAVGSYFVGAHWGLTRAESIAP